MGSIPGSGRYPGGGHGNPLQYSYLVNPHGQRSLVGHSHKESDTTEAAEHTQVQGLLQGPHKSARSHRWTQLKQLSTYTCPSPLEHWLLQCYMFFRWVPSPTAPHQPSPLHGGRPRDQACVCSPLFPQPLAWDAAL